MRSIIIAVVLLLLLMIWVASRDKEHLVSFIEDPRITANEYSGSDTQRPIYYQSPDSDDNTSGRNDPNNLAYDSRTMTGDSNVYFMPQDRPVDRSKGFIDIYDSYRTDMGPVTTLPTPNDIVALEVRNTMKSIRAQMPKLSDGNAVRVVDVYALNLNDSVPQRANYYNNYTETPSALYATGKYTYLFTIMPGVDNNYTTTLPVENMKFVGNWRILN